MEETNKKRTNLLGAWAFLIGIVIAAIFAIFQLTNAWLPWALFAIGLIVGLLNVKDSESQPFLLAGTSLVIISSLGGSAFSNLAFIPHLLNNILALFVPATIVVALKTVFSMAKG